MLRLHAKFHKNFKSLVSSDVHTHTDRHEDHSFLGSRAYGLTFLSRLGLRPRPYPLYCFYKQHTHYTHLIGLLNKLKTNPSSINRCYKDS